MSNYHLIFDMDAEPDIFIEEEINESTGLKSKKYKIKGIFSTIGEKNRNGRIYPKNLWETEIQKYQENFNSGSINTLMEWEHPARTEVDPMKAVAKITELSIKDNYVMGEAILLNNPQANQIKTLIDNKIKISVSSRGVGSVKNGIVENFKLVTYDLVSAPSDYNASMNGLVENYQLNEGIINELTFTLDSFGNIVVNENISVNSGTPEVEIFNKEDIDSAIKSKFSKIINEMKNK